MTTSAVKPPKIKLTPKQAAIIKIIGAKGLIGAHMCPGREDIDAMAYWVKSPRDGGNLDGRSVEGMIKKGALNYIGDNDYAATERALLVVGISDPSPYPECREAQRTGQKE